jgi:hypothetical protein
MGGRGKNGRAKEAMVEWWMVVVHEYNADGNTSSIHIVCALEHTVEYDRIACSPVLPCCVFMLVRNAYSKPSVWF